MKKILYLTYDGILEPLGSSQVLEYVKSLSSEYHFTLISFEKREDVNNSKLYAKTKSICDKKNITWIAYTYYPLSRPFLALGSLLMALLKLLRLFSRNKIQAIHLRGYTLGFMIPILNLFFNFKFFFDTRGFWADEKADRAGWSKDGLLYQTFKKLESYLFQKSSHTFFLTNHAQKIVEASSPGLNAKSSVIRTCANGNYFYPLPSNADDGVLKLGYLGTMDTAYDFLRIAKFFSAASQLNQKIFLTILTKSNHEKIYNILLNLNINESLYRISFTRDLVELNKEINNFDLCIFYLNQNFSIQASMPTKIGEVLACGVPIVCNNFNEDMQSLFNPDTLLLTDFDAQECKLILEKMLKLKHSEDTPKNCLKIYREYFSLEQGCKEYNRCYETHLQD
jgi:glycosyltransferase involved in cell wall biosynthesis